MRTGNAFTPSTSLTNDMLAGTATPCSNTSPRGRHRVRIARATENRAIRARGRVASRRFPRERILFFNR